LAALGDLQSEDGRLATALAEFASTRTGLDPRVVEVKNSVAFRPVHEVTEVPAETVCNREVLSFQGHDAYEFHFQKAGRLAAAVLEGGRVVSLATDNGNGSISVMTRPEFWRRGLATGCVNRLIFEYHGEFHRLGYATTLGNVASQGVARACGMAEASRGYWVTIRPEAGRGFAQRNPQYFESDESRA